MVRRTRSRCNRVRRGAEYGCGAGCGMKLFASLESKLDAKDRKLLAVCLTLVVLVAILTGVFARNQNNDDNPLPSSFLTGKHGARAAFEMLVTSGYNVERWE